MKTNVKKTIISSAVLPSLLAVSLVSSNANADFASNMRALPLITATAIAVCTAANEHKASFTKFKVSGTASISNLYLKLLTIDNLGLKASYEKSSQQGILVGMIHNNLVAGDILDSPPVCARFVFNTLQDKLLTS